MTNLPAEPELELAILAGMSRSPHALGYGAECLGAFMFTLPDHRLAFHALCRCHADDAPTSGDSLLKYLPSGHKPYVDLVRSLSLAEPPEDFEEASRILVETAATREFISATETCAELARSGRRSVYDLADDLGHRLHAIACGHPPIGGGAASAQDDGMIPF
jgi:replicative DNA helicase